ncbi:hypothetical protein CMI40_01850 [Candidatus Pacearchaeota archaeon]|jgi:hypothetical protein|nr:hypothetical protein [Candidatus Pacearchaeota archaeon]|tara:strand:+ start:25313 stop:25912 length:600 start_codon:yes stop_codon:yes gene_type:complete
MIPKIIFRYSRIYDQKFRDSKLIQKNLIKRNHKYPSIKKIENYIKKIEKLWKKEGEKILKEIAKITGFKWKEKEIICYVIGIGGCFSDPLTIKIFKNTSYFIDVLTHELIHQIQTQNHNLFIKWFNYIRKNYKDEPKTTKSHILLHAVHWKLLETLFDKERVKKIIKKHNDFKDYKRAWKIVEEVGAEDIIKKFKLITK